MTWTSRAPVLAEALHRALAQGVTAGAYVYANAVKRGLAGGYTSGAWVTGNVMNSVTVVPAVPSPTDIVAYVGTNVLYALFWEVGHQNLFTRRHEQVEVWRPTLLAEGGAIHARIREVTMATVQAMGPA